MSMKYKSKIKTRSMLLEPVAVVIYGKIIRSVYLLDLPYSVVAFSLSSEDVLRGLVVPGLLSAKEG